MRTILFFCVALIASTTILKAQETPWTKDARNMVYNELLNELTPYKDLSQEQKESIALCGLDEITKKYSMTNYQSKIEVELKRIKSATIGQCSKNIGVNLEISAPNKTEEKIIIWTKEGKSNLYNEALTIFSKYELSQQQREMLSLCFADEITKDYSKIDLDNMIEAELKKVKNDYLKKCLDKNNITLKRQNNGKLDKKSLVGCWQSYDFTICFYETGDMEKHMDKGFFKKTKGKWFLESEKIIFVMKEIKEEYKIIYFSGESLKLEEINSKKEFHFTKMLNF